MKFFPRKFSSPRRLPVNALALLVALAAALATGPSAWADDKATARELFLQGNELMQQGRYVQALEQYQKAYDLYPSHKVLLNIGTAYLQLGRLAEAADTYDLYLRDRKAERKDDARAMLRKLGTQVGLVRIRAREAGLTLHADSRRLGDTPFARPVRLDPGRRMLVAERDGQVVWTGDLFVAAGSTQTVVIERAATDATTTHATHGDDRDARPAARDDDHDDHDDATHAHTQLPDTVVVARPARSHVGLKIASLSTAALGLVAVGFGVKFGLDAKRIGDDLSTVQVWDADAERRYRAGETAHQRMFIAYGVGAGALLAAGIMYMLSGDSGGTEITRARVSWRPVLAPGSALMTVEARF